MNKLLRNILGDTNNNSHRNFTSSLSFDGTNDFGQFGNTGGGLWSGNPIANYFNINVAFSFSFWFKPNFAVGLSLFNPTFRHPVVNEACYFGANGFSFGQSTNFRALILDFKPYCKNLVHNHFCGTYNNNSSPSGCKMYVNGVNVPLTAIDNGSRAVRAWDLHYLARQADSPTSYFSSIVSDFRFYNGIALTPQEARNLYNRNWQYDLPSRIPIVRLPMTLPAHFENNVPAGQCRVLDTSGNSNHLIISGQGTTPTVTSFY